MFTETESKNKKAAFRFRLIALIYLLFVGIGIAGYNMFHFAQNTAASGVDLGITFFAGFYGFCWLVLYKNNAGKLLKNLTAKEKIYSLLWLLLMNGFTLLEMIREQKVYYWDSATYWQKTIEANRLLLSSPSKLLDNLYQTINTDDYNMVIPTVLALPTRIFGESHLTHVLLVLNLFLIPCALLIALIAKKEGEGHAPPFHFLLGIILLVPALTLPTLAGYLDAFSMLTLALAFFILVEANLYKFDLEQCILLAVTLILTILGRRYFLYPIVGIIAACCIVTIVRLVLKNLEIRSLLSFAANFILTGGICCGVFVLSFGPFVQRTIFGSYDQQYSAYQKGSFFLNYKLFFQYFGLLLAVLCLIGIVRNYIDKKWIYPTFLICSLFVSVSLFFRVQSMDAHHYYIIIIPVLLLLLNSVSSFRAFHCIRQKYIAWLVLLCVGMNFLYAYAPLFASAQSFDLATSIRYQPEHRDDIQNISALAGELNTLSKQNGNTKIYLLSSSNTLNYNTLQNVNAPYTFQAVPALYSSAEVDQRDGFPTQFLRSGIVVICDPIQYCLAPKDQKVVGLLADDILNDNRFANNFKFVNEITLRNNVKAKIFLKTSPLTAVELKTIQDQFNGAYPKWNLNLTK